MLKPSVATCFNPSCEAEFRRMGDGKLFVAPLRSVEHGQARAVVWLCAECTRKHSLHYDDAEKQFVLSPHRPHVKRLA